MTSVKVYQARCTGCYACVDVCPVAVFTMESSPIILGHKVSVVANEAACIACGICEVQCEGNCITIGR